MDWDTGFLADPKFQHLRDLLPDPVQFGYAGFSYLRLSADAWRTCERHPLGDIVRGIEPWAGDALRDAGLLDDAFCLPTTSFDKWVGSGIEARNVWKENKRKVRDSHPVSESPKVSTGLSGTPKDLRIGRESTVGTVDEVGRYEGVPGEDAVWTFLAQHGAYIRPDGALGRRLVGLLERRGAEAVMTEAVSMAKADPVMSDRQWVLGLENGMERVPSGRVSVDAAIKEENEARNDARYERMVARRIEWFRESGKWDDSWGDKPDGIIANS
jgi:hypothetical protein